MQLLAELRSRFLLKTRMQARSGYFTNTTTSDGQQFLIGTVGESKAMPPTVIFKRTSDFKK